MCVCVCVCVHVGAYELSMGLRNSFGDLWSLDLRHNRIASKGAIALAGCLPVCPALREVVLNHNKIGKRAHNMCAA